MKHNLIYFELNDWWAGRDYPEAEPFMTWMNIDTWDKYFRNEKWIAANHLSIVEQTLDQSNNFCITATKEWVEKNCPSLLAQYREFCVLPEDTNECYGRWGTRFLNYDEGYEFRGDIE